MELSSFRGHSWRSYPTADAPASALPKPLVVSSVTPTPGTSVAARRIARKMERLAQDTLARPPLNTKVKRGIRAFLGRLEDASLPPVSRCILYGSCARGDSDQDSDVDLAVVFPGEPPDSRTRVRLGWALCDIQSQVLLDTQVVVSQYPVWEGQLRDTDGQRNPQFFRNMLADGIEVTAGL